MKKTYKIAVIGGTGKVGRYIADIALQKGYQVRMLVRNPERLAHKNDRIEIVKGDIQDPELIYKLLKDCQIVINTFGQPVKEIPMYSEVTGNILEIMKELQISRYIGVTGGSLTINGDKKSVLNRAGAKMFEIFFPKMMKDKKKEWDILFHNKLIEWTVIRLPFVVDGSRTGHVKEDLKNMPGTKITNQDIAAFIINEIENQEYIHKAPFIAN
ncbi:NAD(P)-dependent oxidoreductase [Metabacillus fastidiosus]|uniref:NAD(P)-dependent oxidoreductase n=1 Tax=Metabacillus fastidiosus TaxID=1458 RepID=UPI003D2667C1